MAVSDMSVAKILISQLATSGISSCNIMAILYGSRAKGNFKKGSDIDLTLFGAELNQQSCSTIAEALDDLLLPYTIDLSVFDQLKHPALEAHIERVGKMFYQRKVG